MNCRPLDWNIHFEHFDRNYRVCHTWLLLHYSFDINLTYNCAQFGRLGIWSGTLQLDVLYLNCQSVLYTDDRNGMSIPNFRSLWPFLFIFCLHLRVGSNIPVFQTRQVISFYWYCREITLGHWLSFSEAFFKVLLVYGPRLLRLPICFFRICNARTVRGVRREKQWTRLQVQ